MFARFLKNNRTILKQYRLYSSNEFKKTSNIKHILSYTAGGAVLGSITSYFYYESKNNTNVLAKTFNNSTIKISDLSEKKYCSEKDLENAIIDLKTKINPKHIIHHPDTLLSHSDNGCNPIKPLESQKPKYVIYAESTQEVSEILKIMHKYKVPTIPYGGGTSLEQHFFTTRENTVV
ncbi:hypothetical protein HANVADRAFT_50481 [Hanseniaspora valbyensis NRRL Y-1626]|uniref:FAD linked oxidase N-terminal domain-containing protein n=1 Tax=Hanseniaspora valbyensis NRRL Y-1626 TaxID=766949 RepID=A0A1B7T8A7_9ASCO|nr:hypothetical protein HANVADRAFT_50481 [Hanseniaspora valbyensis NRRL Y-1626]